MIEENQQIEKNGDLIKLYHPENYFNLLISGQSKKNEYYQKFECTVCYEIPLKPVQCKKCHQKYCLCCVSNQKKAKNTCAFRCKGDFLIEKCQNFNPTFVCPYNPQCEKNIPTSKQFFDHAIACKFGSKTQIQLLQNRNLYKCFKGQHYLEFFIGTYEQMISSSVCALCERKALCRSYCRICYEKYCLDCRPVQTIKHQCPIGHTLQKKKMANMVFICDFCSLPSMVVGQHLYDDPECNFGICELCADDLPLLRNTKIPMLVNQPQFCYNSSINSFDRNDHRLIIQRSGNIQEKCALCKTMKSCPQKCNKCDIKYCFNCKPFLAFTQDWCTKKHKILKCNVPPQTNPCDNCGQVFQSQSLRYNDELCKISLCKKCINYGVNIMSERFRMQIPAFCHNEHTLYYYFNIKEYYKPCSGCFKNKPIKLYCNMCYKTYCCACKPISNILLMNNQCYYKHKLIKHTAENLELILQSYKEQNNGKQHFSCHACAKQITNDQMIRCDICNLNICDNCVENKMEAQPINLGQNIGVQTSSSQFESIGF